MKQGQATFRGPADQKVEPNPKLKSPAAVSYLGNAKGNHATDAGDFTPNYPNMNLGNGFSPNGPVEGWDEVGPGAGRVIRSSGSQGKH